MDDIKKRNILANLPYKAIEVDRTNDLPFFLCSTLERPTYYRCRRPHYANSGVRGWRQTIKDWNLHHVFRVFRLGRRVIFTRYTYNKPLSKEALLLMSQRFPLDSDIPPSPVETSYNPVGLRSHTYTVTGERTSPFFARRIEWSDISDAEEPWRSVDDVD